MNAFKCKQTVLYLAARHYPDERVEIIQGLVALITDLQNQIDAFNPRFAATEAVAHETQNKLEDHACNLAAHSE